MTCERAPARVCKPCEEGHRVCAYRLLLDSKAEYQLRRLDWLIGGNPWQVPNPKASKLEQQREDREPKTDGACWNCSRPQQLFTYLVEFLKLRGARWPMCEVCR